MTERLITSDIYLRRTASADKKITVTHHWVWDAPAFLDSQQREQRRIASEKKDFQIIEPATREDYRAFTWPNQSK